VTSSERSDGSRPRNSRPRLGQPNVLKEFKAMIDAMTPMVRQRVMAEVRSVFAGLATTTQDR
jgi:hypothetical protein